MAGASAGAVAGGDGGDDGASASSPQTQRTPTSLSGLTTVVGDAYARAAALTAPSRERPGASGDNGDRDGGGGDDDDDDDDEHFQVRDLLIWSTEDARSRGPADADGLGAAGKQRGSAHYRWRRPDRLSLSLPGDDYGDSASRPAFQHFRYRAATLFYAFCLFAALAVAELVMRPQLEQAALPMIIQMQQLGEARVWWADLVGFPPESWGLAPGLALSALPRWRRVGVRMLLLQGTGRICRWALSLLFRQGRPFWVSGKVKMWHCPTTFGFPSGHALLLLLAIAPVVEGLWAKNSRARARAVARAEARARRAHSNPAAATAAPSAAPDATGPGATAPDPLSAPFSGGTFSGGTFSGASRSRSHRSHRSHRSRDRLQSAFALAGSSALMGLYAACLLGRLYIGTHFAQDLLCGAVVAILVLQVLTHRNVGILVDRVLVSVEETQARPPHSRLVEVLLRAAAGCAMLAGLARLWLAAVRAAVDDASVPAAWDRRSLQHCGQRVHPWEGSLETADSGIAIVAAWVLAVSLLALAGPAALDPAAAATPPSSSSSSSEASAAGAAALAKADRARHLNAPAPRVASPAERALLGLGLLSPARYGSVELQLPSDSPRLGRHFGPGDEQGTCARGVVLQFALAVVVGLHTAAALALALYLPWRSTGTFLAVVSAVFVYPRFLEPAIFSA